MTTKSFLACEQKKLRPMKKYQLPHSFKKIGIAITICSFLAMFLNKFTFDQPEYRLIAKYGLLVGLLLVSISKEKIEDELVIKIRMESYTFAFVVGVAYALFLPFVDYMIDAFFRAKEASLDEMGDFEILWILLSFQVLCFEYLKKLH